MQHKQVAMLQGLLQGLLLALPEDARGTAALNYQTSQQEESTSSGEMTCAQALTEAAAAAPATTEAGKVADAGSEAAGAVASTEGRFWEAHHANRRPTRARTTSSTKAILQKSRPESWGGSIR